MSRDNSKCKQILLRTGLPPGDILTLTAAIYSLKQEHPEYEVDTRTNFPEIFSHNPDVTMLRAGKLIDMHYPLINKSNSVPAVYLHGYTAYLGQQLGVPLTLHTNRPHLYLGENEKPQHELPRPYMLISAGIKHDFTCKAWPVEYYQEVVNHVRHKVNCVQIGRTCDSQPELDGVIDLVGQTNLRELIRLGHDATMGLGPSTLLQHICAAWRVPYICLLGGRESLPWQASYNTQHTLHTIGQLDCCKNGGCWKSKVVSPVDKSVCKHPCLDFSRPVAQCMKMIKPDEVVAIINRQLEAPPPSCATTLTTARSGRREGIRIK